MNKIIISDNDELDVVLPFCRSEGLGIELQSFCNPSLSESYADQIEYQLNNLQGIAFRTYHGPFGDLNCGSYGPLNPVGIQAEAGLGLPNCSEVQTDGIRESYRWLIEHGFEQRI